MRKLRLFGNTVSSVCMAVVVTLVITVTATAPAMAGSYGWWIWNTYYKSRQPVLQPAPQPAPPAASPSHGSFTGTITADEQAMIDLINRERAAIGRAPLKADLELTRAAHVKADDIVSVGYFSHYSPTYGSPRDMLRSLGISFQAASENLARMGPRSTFSDAHRAFMNSPGHRQTLLSARWTHVGVALVRDPQGRLVAVEEFAKR